VNAADSIPVPQCSRAGCRASARWNIHWRNPRIHAEDRVKVWLACEEHRDFLRDYLASRGFPVDVVALPGTRDINADQGSK
jgi:hypothetical protein